MLASVGRYKGETAERAVRIALEIFPWYFSLSESLRILTQLDSRHAWIVVGATKNRKWRPLRIHVANVTFCWVNFIESTDLFGLVEEKSWYISRDRYAWKVESDSDTCCVGSTTTTWCKVSLIKRKNISRANIFWGKISLKRWFRLFWY